MKIILSTLLLSTLALCELPPPYLQRGFRPSPQFRDQSSSSQYPQTQYGPPRLQSNSLDVKIPSKITIEQLIRLTEQLHSSQGRIVNRPQTIQLSAPQNSYIPPSRQPQIIYGSPNKIQHSQVRPPPTSNFGVNQPQSSYGTPQISQQSSGSFSRPQNQYVSPQWSNFAPQTSYGVPNKVQAPENLGFGASGSQGKPQTSYGVPNVQQFPQGSNVGAANNQFHPQIPPSTNYGVPDIRNIETFGDLSNKPQRDEDILRQNLLSDLMKQHLPFREPTGFRTQESRTDGIQNVPNLSQEYLPASGANNFGVQPQNGFENGKRNPNFISQSPGGNPSFTQDGSQLSPQEGQNRNKNIPNVNQEYLPANEGNNIPSNTIQRPQNGLGRGLPGNLPNNIPQGSTGGSNNPNTPENFGSGRGSTVNPTFSQGDNQFGNTATVTPTSNRGETVNKVNQNYLPPQTTPRTRVATRTTTVRSRTTQTTPETPEGTTNYDYDYDLEQQTEAPSNEDGSASDPNVSISNAVAGGGGYFYLQQPDGRLQRVVLQKTQEPNSKPEEYVANYYFQNVQALPSVAYTPVVSLGAWK